MKELQHIYRPPSEPGFLGNGHVARRVIQVEFVESDPFIILMDDLLDKKDDSAAGGPHPHAGFETATLVIEGELGDGEHGLKAGDFEMMTAGSGVVHTETITKQTKLRILQLWLNLPKKDRWAQPRIQKLKAEHVPFRREEGVAVKVYSGSFFGLQSAVQNHTPVIIADVELGAGKSIQETLPGNYTTFVYILSGSIEAGSENDIVKKDHVGWFARSTNVSDTLELMAGDNGARFILYAGEPQNHTIVSHGPFIADSMDEIRNLYADFRHGKIRHINDVAESL